MKRIWRQRIIRGNTLSRRLAHHWVELDGLPMYARVPADPLLDGRPAVVLVHGFAVSGRYLLPTAELLAPDFRVYVPDFPGYGLSEGSRHVPGVAETADLLARWMDLVGLPRAALLANSLGCQVAVEFALRHAGRAERLVLQAPTVDPAARTWLRQWWRLMRVGLREPLSLLPIVIRDYVTAGLRRVLASTRDALSHRMEERLPQVQLPALVVRGSRDVLVPQRWAEEAARLLPRGRLIVIPGGAHAVNYDAPGPFVQAIRPFLEGSEG